MRRANPSFAARRILRVDSEVETVRQPEQRVGLRAISAPAAVVSLTAWTDKEGLVIEGYDYGPAVESLFGDSDYRYWLSVDRRHYGKVFKALEEELGREIPVPKSRADQDTLLVDLLKRAWFRELFSTDVDFRKWLDARGIPSKFSSYA